MFFGVGAGIADVRICQDTLARPHRDYGANPLRSVPVEAATRFEGVTSQPAGWTLKRRCGVN